MASPAPAADELRADVLTFLARAPDAKLGDVVRACRTTRREASRTLDDLIRDGLVRFRHPWLVRLGGPLLALLVGAERYSLTEEGQRALPQRA